MAVAVKNTAASVMDRPLNRFAVNSWLGVAYVIGALAAVSYGIGWIVSGLALTDAGLSTAVQASVVGLLRIAAVAGLVYLGIQLVGAQAQRGLSAGIVFGVVTLLTVGLFTCWLGRTLENQFGARSTVAMVSTIVVGIGLLGGAAYLYLLPRFERRLIEVEEQGWFTIAPYKRTQGQKVRRGTILGLLVLAGCGIWTLMTGESCCHSPTANP
jgi:hypothetical protein